MDSRLQALVDQVRPEAREIVDAAMADTTTQNGYGLVMALLGNMSKDMQKLLLVAMTAEGYPIDTSVQLAQILGI